MIKNLMMVAALVAVTGQAAARDCVQGEALYNEGLNAGKSGNMSLAVSKLEQSLAVCETFESAYLLGQAQQQLGNNGAAEEAFEQAQGQASNGDAAAIALGRLAEVKRAQGDTVEALSVVQEARDLHSSPPAWMNELAMDLDSQMANQPLQVEQVTRALTLPKRAFHIVDKPPASGGSPGGAPVGGGAAPNPYANNPSINVRINFMYDSTEVESQSQSNLQVLADALAQSTFDGKQFILIGHTDVRGDRSYNQGLSEQRARAVQIELMSLSPELRGRLRTEGAGESRPLYKGQGEREHGLNRRLEVVVAS